MPPSCEAEGRPNQIVVNPNSMSTPFTSLLSSLHRCWVWRTGQRSLERITAALQCSDALRKRIAAAADDSHQVEAHLALVAINALLYDRAHTLQPVLLRWCRALMTSS